MRGVLPPGRGGRHEAAGRRAGSRRGGAGGAGRKGPAPYERRGAGEGAGEPSREKHRHGSGTRMEEWRPAPGGCGLWRLE